MAAAPRTTALGAGDRRDPVPTAPQEVVRPVEEDEWPVVAWLWQAFRQDLAVVVDGFPYADGRYQAGPLEPFPSPDAVGYVAWRAHPKTGETAPMAFALVDGVSGTRRSMVGFWVAPAARRSGVGRRLAIDVIARHPQPWLIGFQQENTAAGPFWRRVADEAFGRQGWTETRLPVPGLPDAPPDHVISV